MSRRNELNARILQSLSDWTPDEERELLRDPARVQAAIAKLLPTFRKTHVIDLDADVPLQNHERKYLRVVRHERQGVFHWEEGAMGLYYPQCFKNDGTVDMVDLLEELRGHAYFNFNARCYMLKHPEAIPANIAKAIDGGTKLLFPGTVLERFGPRINGSFIFMPLYHGGVVGGYGPKQTGLKGVAVPIRRQLG